MMRLEVLPVTVPDGDNSSPSVPEGTGGPKSKSKRERRPVNAVTCAANVRTVCHSLF